jgi:hypothetical protein
VERIPLEEWSAGWDITSQKYELLAEEFIFAMAGQSYFDKIKE